MRDPQRIHGVLEAVRRLWIQYPDWRLCQLVVNVAGTNDPFNMEDDEFLECAKDWLLLMEEDKQAD